MCVRTHAQMHISHGSHVDVRGQLICQSQFSLLPCGARDWTQVVWLGGRVFIHYTVSLIPESFLRSFTLYEWDWRKFLEIGIHYVLQASLEFWILLPESPDCRDSKCVPPHPTPKNLSFDPRNFLYILSWRIFPEHLNIFIILNCVCASLSVGMCTWVSVSLELRGLDPLELGTWILGNEL